MKKAYLLLAAGIITLSFSSLIVKMTEAPAPVIAFYRVLFCAVILTPFFLRTSPGHAKENGAGWAASHPWIYPLSAGFSNALDYALTMIAMKITTIANATILNNIAPLWVGLAAVLIFRKKLSGKYWLGMLLSFVGAIFVISSGFFSEIGSVRGCWIALCSSFFYAGYYILTQQGREYYSSLRYYCLMLFSSTVWLFLLNLIMGNPLSGYPLKTWLLFLFAAVFCQILGQFTITAALGSLPANVVSTTMLLQPIGSAVLAFLILGEKMLPLQWIGGIIALIGIYFVNTEQDKQSL